MRLVTFSHRGRKQAGVLRGDETIGLAEAGFADLLSVIRGGAGALERIAAFDGLPVEGETTLCAPIPNPSKILCLGLNYRDHAREAGLEIPSTCPTVFAKFPNTIVGDGAPIVLPRNSQKPDYEAEFAFVIGKGGRHIKAADWREHVFGYLNLNDVSARDVQFAASQWTMGKNFDTFTPMGPWLVTADEIENPHNLDISLRINGEVLQQSSTRELIFKIPEIVEFLSGIMTLAPGDIVSTGTPAGVGFARTPPRWLQPGDTIEVRVEGLGELRNVCVAEDPLK